MKRRNILAGGAASVGILAPTQASAQDGAPPDPAAAVARIRASIPSLSKENVLPRPLGLIYKGWKLSSDEGLIVFLHAA